MRIRNLLLLITLFCLTLPATAQAQTRHQRGDWYIGFGLGGGLSADYKIDGDTVTFDDWLEGLDKDSKLSLNFKVGGTIDSKNLLGFDITAVNQTGTAIGVDALIQINNYFLMWTHFPREEGAFFRLGGGLSNIVAEVNSSFGDFSDRVNGEGLLLGVGYAFWLGQSFNLTLNLDHSRQWYSSGAGEPDSSQFTIFYIGFDWY